MGYVGYNEEREKFNVAGPLHLTSVDWSNFRHRSSVAACLVRSTSILEMDRQKRRRGPQANAPSWWEFFGFKLKQVLVDPKDQSIFGAIYELKFSTRAGKPPKRVIAFRGTLIRQESWSQDIKLHFDIIQNTLHNSFRVHDGSQAVQTAVSKVGAKNVWLAGHSLGSAIALLVGRNMVLEMGYHLETYLFNPPFVSLLVQIIKNEKIQRGIRAAHSVVKAGMAAAMGYAQNKNIVEDDEDFTLLFPWVPYLFINPSDPICGEYLGYFQHRERMAAAGVGEIGRVVARNTVMSMVANARGKDSKPSHLIPSAYLMINLNRSPDLRTAHKLSQWWQPDLKLDYKLYQLDNV